MLDTLVFGELMKRSPMASQGFRGKRSPRLLKPTESKIGEVHLVDSTVN